MFKKLVTAVLVFLGIWDEEEQLFKTQAGATKVMTDEIADSSEETDQYDPEREEYLNWPQQTPEEIQAETNAAWVAYYASKEAEEDKRYHDYEEQRYREEEEMMNNQICPCGHKSGQHEGSYGEGHCTVGHCDCPQFGEPPENYETYTKGYLGDPGDNMGLTTYE